MKAIIFEYSDLRFGVNEKLAYIENAMDELDLIESVIDVENEFQIEIDDHEWRDLLKDTNTMADVIMFVENKIRIKNES